MIFQRFVIGDAEFRSQEGGTNFGGKLPEGIPLLVMVPASNALH